MVDNGILSILQIIVIGVGIGFRREQPDRWTYLKVLAYLVCYYLILGTFGDIFSG